MPRSRLKERSLRYPSNTMKGNPGKFAQTYLEFQGKFMEQVSTQVYLALKIYLALKLR
jgi:hypothetical protein